MHGATLKILYQPPKSETSDHISDNENSPPPRKTSRENNNPEKDICRKE
jgi:hypothetical protein